MPRYLSLLKFTDQGLGKVEKSAERAAAFRKSVESRGGKVVSQYWAMGPFDGAVVFETPDDDSATGLLLALGRLGNVRTETIRVFSESEFAGIVSKLPT